MILTMNMKLKIIMLLMIVMIMLMMTMMIKIIKTITITLIAIPSPQKTTLHLRNPLSNPIIFLHSFPDPLQPRPPLPIPRDRMLNLTRA